MWTINDMDYSRGGYFFRNFFDADVDADCHQDEWGVEVYKENSIGELVIVGQIFWYNASDFEDMTDDEFYKFIEDSAIQ